MKSQPKNSLQAFLLELLVYAGLVAGYYFLVLHLLGDWLSRLYHADRAIYAGVALGLILGQGVLLEIVTRLLLNYVRPSSEDE